MSTRCEIGLLLPEGGVHVIYNHHDGYLDGVGLDLIENWNSYEKAEEVVHGAYNNEKWQWDYNTINDWINFLKKSDREYAYLWRNDHWEYISSYWSKDHVEWNTEWKDVKKGLRELQKQIDGCFIIF
jgi:hypothetical protein